MPSLSSRLVTAQLRRIEQKRVLTDTELFHRAIEFRRRHPASAEPPKSLRRKVSIVPQMLCGWLCYRLTPPNSAPGPGTLYLHGGAYVAEIQPTHWWALADIARRSGIEITVPIYPLAPAATAERTVATATDIAARAAPGFTLMGDSAGGGMALAVLQQLRLRRAPQPRRAVLLSPWLDVTIPDPAAAELARTDVILDIPGLLEAGRLYAGDLPVDDPRVSPIHGELTGLAPIVLFSGTAELLNPDARRLAAAGTGIDYVECPGGQHCYPLLRTREGKQARRHIAELLRTPGSAGGGERSSGRNRGGTVRM
ncbi:alpha/beta hydrolase fold domain-containing protein [Nocardia sp. NPDC127579]|uniref:alpha/beta hydrolase fold domain-containing protein n=1 Tax=Nocardia sp. NPDC127579 TaxID=3345402 RepID=UPI003638F86F